MSAAKSKMPQEAYEADLAYIHDVGFRAYSENAAPGLLRLLARHGIDNGLVVDLGCGSGLWARRLSEAGYDVLGIDISATMIAMARERVPSGEFRVGSVLDAVIPPCVAVTSLGECFNYLFDTSNSRRAQRALFKRIYRALSPGGLFVFDMIDPKRLPRENPVRTFIEGDGWVVLVHADRNDAKQRLRRRITTFRKDGKAYRRGDEVHVLRLCDKAEVAADLREAGFRVQHLRGFGEKRFTGHQMGFLARKAAA